MVYTGAGYLLSKQPFLVKLTLCGLCWEFHGECDSLAIRHQFPNLSGARNQISHGEFLMENSLLGNSWEYFW